MPARDQHQIACHVGGAKLFVIALGLLDPQWRFVGPDGDKAVEALAAVKGVLAG